MVTVNKNSEDIRNGRRSRGASPSNGYSDDSSASDPEPEGQMRVGSDYQAVIPPFNPNFKQQDTARAEAMLVWAPSRSLPESRIDQYIQHAKEKHNYNMEQSLGMLFWHRHDIEKALSDLSNFTPFPDEWTVEDKVLFEQAFSFHGKSFHRIRQMLPDKSIASLVKYYYSWKKTRSRTSLMDRQARRFNSQEDADSDDSDGSGANDSDFDNSKENGKAEKKETCANCGVASSQQHSTTKGNLCSTCYQYWRRTGLMRPNVGPRKEGAVGHSASHGRHNPIKNRRKPPRGMYMNAEDLHMIASGPTGQGEQVLKGLDAELVQLKRQVQNNKQMLSVVKHRTLDGIDACRAPEANQKVNPRWTNEELLLAVQGVRKYGKNFRAIAETIGNKTEGHVRNFFVSYKTRYSLDECLREYEAENGTQEDMDIKELDKMDTDEKPVVVATERSDMPTPTLIDTKPVPVDSKAGPPPLLKQPPGSPQKSPIAPRLSSSNRPSLHHPPPLIKPSTQSPNKATSA